MNGEYPKIDQSYLIRLALTPFFLSLDPVVPEMFYFKHHVEVSLIVFLVAT